MSQKFYAMLSHYTGYASGYPDIQQQNFSDSFGTAKSAGDQALDLADYNQNTRVTIDTDGESTVADLRLYTASEITPNGIVILNQNLHTAGAKIEPLYDAVGSNPTAVAVASGTLGGTYTPEDAGAVTTISEDGFVAYTFYEASDNDFMVRCRPVSTNFTADITMGQIYFARVLTPSLSYDLTGNFGYSGDGVQVSVTQNGHKYANINWASRRFWSLNYPNMTSTDKNDFQEFFQICNGQGRPFLFYDDREDAYYWCRLTQNGMRISPKSGDYGAFDISLTFEEEI